MPTASLSLLGGFDARLHSGGTLTLPTHKYKALLAFLAVPAGQRHPRDRLVALLWGDHNHEQGRTALRQGVWVLRKALNSATSAGLVIDGDLVGVDPAGVAVDVAEFERAAANGAPIDLERAATLYRGEFLAGVAARERPFEEWLTVQRERLGELALQSLARLLGHQRKMGLLGAAAQTALRLLSLDPLEESVHRVLMQTYMDMGRRAAALRQYQACVTVLQREIGTEPDAATRALYRAIVSQRVASAVQSPSRASATDRHAHAAAAAPEMTAPFIGRRLEMTLIHEALDESIAGRGQIVVILGEAGMGKSRLVEALSADAAGRGARVIVGHCFDAEQVLPYGPWTDALQRQDLAGDERMVATLPAMSRAALGRFVPELVPAELVRDPSGADHMQVFDAVARLIEALAAREPLVLVVEDAHWADDISLRLLSFLARRLHGARPVLLVLTARAEELADAPALQRVLDDLDRNNTPLQISLAPLDRRETERLVAALGGGRAQAALARLNDSIWSASQGSPFMVVETLNAVRDGADADAQGELPLPERVRRIVARRLERLSVPARQLAATAAVIGRDFGFDLLQRASGVGVSDAVEAMEELVRRHIFVEAGAGFDFGHDRIREVARQALLGPRRRLLHRQVAETLEALYGEHVDAHAAVLGHHYRQAEVWDRALSYLDRAGAHAHARGAVREAAVMLAHAIEAQERLPAGSVSPEERFDLRLRAARPLYACGDMIGFETRIRELRTLAEALGDRRLLGIAHAHACEYLRSVHDHDRAREAGEAGLALAIEVGDETLQDQANFQLGCLYSWRGDEQRALGYLEAATAKPPRLPSLGPIGTLTPYLPALGRRLAALAALGRFAEAQRVAADAIRLVDAGANPAAFPLAQIGGMCVLQGNLNEGIAHLVHSLDIQREHGFAVVRAASMAFLAEAYALAGRQPEALALLNETADWATSMPTPAQRGAVLARLGYALLLVGHIEDARRFGTCALEFATRYAACGTEAMARRLLGEVALHEATSSADDYAEGQLQQALALAATLVLRPVAAHCRVGLARVCQHRGKHHDAREHLASAIGMYLEMEMPFWAGRAQELLAPLA
jgi:DNA-binding SARP family transcriptional activator